MGFWIRNTGIAAVLCCCFFSNSAEALEGNGSGNTSIHSALAEYQAGELDSAYASFVNILERGGLAGEQLGTVHYYLGILVGAKGDHSKSEQHFRRMFLLEPSRIVESEELGPSIMALVDRARSYVEKHSLKLSIKPKGIVREGQRVVLDAKTTYSDVYSAQEIRISSSGGVGKPLFSRSSEIRKHTSLVIPSEVWETDSIRIQASLLDKYENVLLKKVFTFRPTALRSENRSLVASPWFWIISGVVVAGAAVTIGALAYEPATPLQRDEYVIGVPTVVAIGE